MGKGFSPDHQSMYGSGLTLELKKERKEEEFTTDPKSGPDVILWYLAD